MFYYCAYAIVAGYEGDIVRRKISGVPKQHLCANRLAEQWKEKQRELGQIRRKIRS